MRNSVENSLKMTRKPSPGDWRKSSRKSKAEKRRGRVKGRGLSSASVYGKYGRKYTLSSRAQGVLSTVLEDMIEETLEDARKLAQGTGKDRVAIEDVEMAMVNLCQRLHPPSNSRVDDIVPVEYEPPQKSQHKKHRHRHQDPLRSSDSKRSLN